MRNRRRGILGLAVAVALALAACSTTRSQAYLDRADRAGVNKPEDVNALPGRTSQTIEVDAGVRTAPR